jgi:Flp pilus assembly protein TadD
MRHNLDAARRAYLQALELSDHTPEVYRGLGYALENLGEWAEAGRSFLTYLRLSPEAGDKKVILNHMKVITAQLKQKEVTDAEPRTP